MRLSSLCAGCDQIVKIQFASGQKAFLSLVIDSCSNFIYKQNSFFGQISPVFFVMLEMCSQWALLGIEER